MEDDITTSDGLLDGMRIAQFTCDQLHPGSQVLWKKPQKTRVAARVIADKSPHVGAFEGQVFHQLASDETACACDKDIKVLPEVIHVWVYSE
jgi:hypothetical protein